MVENVVQKRKLSVTQIHVPQMSATALVEGQKLKQLVMNLPERKKVLTDKRFSNFSLKSNLVRSLTEIGLEKVTKLQANIYTYLIILIENLNYY